MISYLQALQMVIEISQKHSRAKQIEKTALIRSRGRVIAEDVYSSQDVPAFNNSAMDGYAILSTATQNVSKDKPVRLKVIGSIAAGETSDLSFIKNSTVQIMTGAKLPETLLFDAIIRQEDAVRIGDEIEISVSVKKGENLRWKGSDFKKGELLLRKGTTLKAEHVSLLATLGVDPVVVYKRPKIALISTGKELVPWESQSLLDSQIRNSSAPYIMTFLERFGIEVDYLGIVPDSPEEYFKTLNPLIKNNQYDMILSTGAVSVGKYDFVESVLKDLGAEIIFHKTAIRPGKPILFASFKEQGVHFFGLPGNVISSMVGVKFFLIPWIRSFLGLHAEVKRKAVLTEGFKKPEGLTCFFRASIQDLDAVVQIKINQDQASYKLKPSLQSQVWVVLPDGKAEFLAGESVEYFYES